MSNKIEVMDVTAAQNYQAAHSVMVMEQWGYGEVYSEEHWIERGRLGTAGQRQLCLQRADAANCGTLPAAAGKADGEAERDTRPRQQCLVIQNGRHRPF